MARRKIEENSLAVVSQEIDQPPETAPIIKPPARPVQKKIKQTSEWVETVDAEEVQEAEEALEFEDDSLEAILRDFEGVSGEEFYIKVWQLPTYAKDGKRGTTATNRAFCDDIPATPDYLKTIRETWGAGAYQLELRSQNGAIKNRRTIQIAAPRFPNMNGQPTVIPNPNNPSQPIILNGQQPQVDIGSLLDAEITRYARIAKLFGGQLGGIQPEAPQPISPELSVAEMLMKDPSHAKQIAKNLLGGNENGEEKTWIDVVFALVNNLPASIEAAKTFFGGQQNGTTPMVAPSLQNIGQGYQQAFMQGGNNQPQHLPTERTQGDAGIQPSNNGPTMQGNRTVNNPAVQVPPEIALLNMSVGMFMERWSPDSAADEIQKYAKLNPDVKPFVEGFMDTTPALALAWIKSQGTSNPVVMQALNSPAAEKWIEALQDYLRPEEGGEEDESK